jgi:hypothetical protein
LGESNGRGGYKLKLLKYHLENFAMKELRSLLKIFLKMVDPLRTKVLRSTYYVCVFSAILITLNSKTSFAEPPGGLLERNKENYSEQREKMRINRAVAHYSRARALIVSAIDEFDKGRQLADPSLLLRGDEWRANLVNRIKEMEKVIAPRPREADAGVSLPADSRLLGSDNAVGALKPLDR